MYIFFFYFPLIAIENQTILFFFPLRLFFFLSIFPPIFLFHVRVKNAKKKRKKKNKSYCIVEISISFFFFFLTSLVNGTTKNIFFSFDKSIHHAR